MTIDCQPHVACNSWCAEYSTYVEVPRFANVHAGTTTGHWGGGAWPSKVAWMFIQQLSLQVLDLLKANEYIIMDEHYDMLLDERTEEPEPGQEARVWGNLIAFVERLDDELFKSLQVSGADFVHAAFCITSFGCSALGRKGNC